MARRPKKPTSEELIEKLQQQFEDFKTAIDIKNTENEEKQSEQYAQLKKNDEQKEKLMNDIREEIHSVKNELSNVDVKVNAVGEELTTVKIEIDTHAKEEVEKEKERNDDLYRELNEIRDSIGAVKTDLELTINKSNETVGHLNDQNNMVSYIL